MVLKKSYILNGTEKFISKLQIGGTQNEMIILDFIPEKGCTGLIML